MQTQLHFRVLVMLMAYLLLKFLGGSFGDLVLYPVTLLVTFLHEFGHAMGAILTGGSVEGLHIDSDGSGYTATRGGSPGIILVGGYVGSALFGNVLFRIGAKHHRLAQGTLLIMGAFMALAGLIWFESFESTLILWVFALSMAFIALRTNFDQDVLMFFGLAAVLYIIQDFNGGPSSDLAMFEKVVGLFPAQIWMYIWLGLVVLLTYWNMRGIFPRGLKF